MQMKVFKLSLQSHILSLAHYKAETKLLVIFFFSILIKRSHTTQVKNKMCKTKFQMRQEDLVFAL